MGDAHQCTRRLLEHRYKYRRPQGMQGCAGGDADVDGRLRSHKLQRRLELPRDDCVRAHLLRPDLRSLSYAFLVGPTVGSRRGWRWNKSARPSFSEATDTAESAAGVLLSVIR